ncbi:unnamed protein product [Brachionus calyciflorus]|uniref:Snake toxin/toxin-like domain-containing protein n=1 Tax=Brachionus calyciflorus TaxID=104777 RepID=A0A813P019_9BILA|nr:unnamed protein product [Brachionus calyciflorus]
MSSFKLLNVLISCLVIFSLITTGLSLRCAVCNKCPGGKHGNSDSFEQPRIQECSPEEKYCIRAVQNIKLDKIQPLRFVNQGCVSRCFNSSTTDLKVTCCQTDECNVKKLKRNNKKVKAG